MRHQHKDDYPVKKLVSLHVSKVDIICGQPVVLLQTEDNSTYVPICIGRLSARTINSILGEIPTPEKPFAIHLCYEIMKNAGYTFKSVKIYHVKDGIFSANIELLSPNETPVSYEVRVSDAISLALLFKGPILATQEIIDEVGISLEQFRNFEDTTEEPEATVEEAERESDLSEESSNRWKSQAIPIEEDPINVLKKKLEEAVREERYEDAARIRDELQRLTNKR